MDAREPDITTCRRVHDVPFYRRTHSWVCLPSLPSQSSARTPIGIALASMPYTLTRRARSSASLGWSIVSVTWTLCETASIKPHFYSGTLHSLRPSGFPRSSPLSVACLPPTFYGPARVRAHPAVSRCIHSGSDFEHAASDILVRVYINNAGKVRTRRREGKHDLRLKHLRFGDFYGSILCACSLRPWRNCHARSCSKRCGSISRSNYDDTINEVARFRAN